MSTSQIYWNFCACVVYRCERIAGAQVAKRASDEYLIGYQLDNELDYKTLNITYWLPMATPGGAQAAQFLAGRYNHSIAELNAAWGINASGFSDVKNHLRDELIWPAVQKGEYNYADNGFQATPAGTDCAPLQLPADNVPWLAVMQEQYLKVAVGAIKRHDPHHLILGMRGQNTGFWAYPEGILSFPGLLNATRNFVDVFDFHTYEDLPEMECECNHAHSFVCQPRLVLTERYCVQTWRGFTRPSTSRCCSASSRSPRGIPICRIAVALAAARGRPGRPRLPTALMSAPRKTSGRTDSQSL